MLIFRRAFIDRTLKQVCVEVAPGQIYTLPGPYNPDKMLATVIYRRYINAKYWVEV